MYYIVETLEEVQSLLDKIRDQTIVCVPIMSDQSLHYVHDYLSLMYIRVLGDDSGVMVCFDHSESLKLEYGVLHTIFKVCNTAYVYDLKCVLQYCHYPHVYDLELVNYFVHNVPIMEQDFNTTVHEHFYNRYLKIKNIHSIIPITKHYEKCEMLVNSIVYDLMKFQITDSFKWYNIVYRQLSKIENVGLYVDAEEFSKHYNTKPVNGLVYTEYNMYTTTGRPSNRHDSVNYAAINSSDGSRKSFTSRYGESGVLVQLDYDAYHVRLLAKLTNYDIDPSVNMHEYLGKMYFGKSSLTHEEYLQSKSITFQNIFGTIRKEYLNIPLFKNIDEYTKLLWSRMRLQGFVYTPIFKRKLHKEFYSDLNPTKLLNYVLQATEMEQSMHTFSTYLQLNLVEYSRVVLYTYDSFLFDVHMSEKHIVPKIKDVFEVNKQFPCKLQVGVNYDSMTTIRTR